MKRALIAMALVAAGMVGGTALTAYAGSPAPAKVAHEPETVEYKFLVLSGSDAATSDHEKELNGMAAQGWRIVAPIYSGGILNSYLMQRVHAEK